MVESATGPLLLRKSKSLPTQKCHAPPAVAESSRLIDIVYPNNSAIFVENRSFQIVPKRECAMNTQSRRHDIYPHRYIDVPRFLTNLSHEKMNIVKLFMCLMRALVPLGEKSSESVPERVLPYRHVLEGYTSANQNFSFLMNI